MPTKSAVSLPGSPDVLIVGAGPAGLACAIAASLRGLRAEVVDSREPPIDKACGEGLMPDTLDALAQLGIDSARLHAAGVPLRGICFLNRDSSVEGSFPNSPGLGVRRTVLHQLLHGRALSLGVRFHWKTVVTGFDSQSVHTNRGTLHARWIAGADGHQSRIRRLARLDTGYHGRQRIGLRQHFTCAPWTNFVEVHWAKGAQAYVTPIASDQVCVVFIGSRKFASVAEALALFPALRRRLAAASIESPPLGAITLNRRLRRVTRGNVALIGDASGSVDAITGEGLALCFRQALALADALEAGDLSLYERAHARIRLLPHLMSHAMLLMDRHPFALAKTFSAFERRPALFPSLLHLHIGHAPLRLLGSGGLLASALCLLAP